MLILPVIKWCVRKTANHNFPIDCVPELITTAEDNKLSLITANKKKKSTRLERQDPEAIEICCT